MFSIYSTAFNVVKNNFDYEEAIDNFCSFAEEVVISVNQSEDNTYEELCRLRDEKYSNLKLIPATVSYEDPRLDGKLFELALQATTQEFKIILGLDQRIPLYQKESWEKIACEMRFSDFDAYMIPVLDLWGDKNKIRWDDEHSTQTMWVLHKEGLHRGVVNFAKVGENKFDPSKSDSNELIYENGELAKFVYYVKGHPVSLQAYLDILKEQNVFIFHIGYLNFENRIKVNKDIWQKQWEEIRPQEKRENEVAVTKEELEKHETFDHDLKLWNE
tara:strand:- start:1486 stop:2304 length:819 start_codon:yes stop_codon:yes gene_type:complete